MKILRLGFLPFLERKKMYDNDVSCLLCTMYMKSSIFGSFFQENIKIIDAHLISRKKNRIRLFFKFSFIAPALKIC